MRASAEMKEIGMHQVLCPHCKAQQIKMARPPKDVVVVMPCPSCAELVILFRDKAIALKRQVIEQGTREERTVHLAEVIGECIDAGLFDQPPGEDAEAQAQAFAAQWKPAVEAAEDTEARAPITQEELERFLRIELKCIDNPSYFKRHFG